MTKDRGLNRSTTDRLKGLIEAELQRQNLTDQEAARDARLPANAFRALRHGHRPSIDRAAELCRAIGITMTIGKTSTGEDAADIAENEDKRGTDG